jgi:translation elongation factor EF-G
MSWIYKGEVFNDSKIPEGALGFIYEMEAIIDGKAVRYIGKKNFYSTTKKKFGVKALANMEDKRAKKYTIQVKTNYQNYYSSNKVLQDAHKAGVLIKRFMVRICFSKTELTYHETKFQFVREVLEKEEYLNQNILGRFYKTK